MMKLFGTLVTMNQNSGEATKLGQAPPKKKFSVSGGQVMKQNPYSINDGATQFTHHFFSHASHKELNILN